MPFPFGKPMLALTVLAALTGGALLFRSPRPAADLTVWTFTPTDAAADQLMVAAFAHHSVRVDLVAAAALDVRLESLFMAGLHPAVDPARPDVVEVEVESVGKFLRGPPADVGFLPLDGYLRRGGWLGRIVPARLVPYSFGGQVFGLPLDLHPVTLVYRRDRIDLSAADTWPRLQAECLRYQQSHGGRFALGLSSTSPDTLLVMLQQRHVDLVDASCTPHLTDPAVVDTVCWYARAAAGAARIGTDTNPGGAGADLAAGDVAALVLPDWAVADLKRAVPSLAGKLAMVPLPRFDAADACTASRGGTMAAVPRFCPRPDLAWQLMEQMYLTREAVAARWRAAGVLPPLPAAWADPLFHQPDLFFAGQHITELYMHLSSELPGRPITPYTTTAQTMLAFVLNRAVSRVRSGGGDLEPLCRGWLADRQAQLQRLIDFDRRTGRLGPPE